MIEWQHFQKEVKVRWVRSVPEYKNYTLLVIIKSNLSKKKSVLQITNNIANGANIDPHLPIIEQMFINVFRNGVGQISAENVYKMANALDVAHIPIKNITRITNVY